MTSKSTQSLGIHPPPVVVVVVVVVFVLLTWDILDVLHNAPLVRR